MPGALPVRPATTRRWAALRLCGLLVGLSLGCVPAAEGRAEEWLYRARAGDTIWDLARRCLRDPKDWPRLQALNRIDEPRRLPGGTVLRFPVDWLRLDEVSARVTALHGDVAVEHAAGDRAAASVGEFGPVQEIDVAPTTWWPAIVVPLVMLLLVL